VNIAFIDSRIATNSDLDGNYVLDTYYPTDSIRAGGVGYTTFSAKVKKDVPQVIDIKLQPSTGQLEDVVVTYSGNPAFPILRRLVANKPTNNREKLAAYQYELTTRSSSTSTTSPRISRRKKSSRTSHSSSTMWTRRTESLSCPSS
jgi:hypothetical protein